MIEKEIKREIKRAIKRQMPVVPRRDKIVDTMVNDVLGALSREGVVKVTKQKLLKTEMLIVVNDDFEDMDHQVDDALKTIENVEGVAAVRIVRTMNMNDEFDEMPLYDNGDIWHEIEDYNDA